MNDFPNAVKNVEITMFADDTSLSKTFQNTDEFAWNLSQHLPTFVNG